MATTEEFNGWPNRETWLVNLWLTNDQGLYQGAREQAAAADSELGAGEAVREMLKELRDQDVPQSGLWVDLINQAFGRVDWRKVGESLREE